MSYRRQALMGPTAADSAAHPGVAKTSTSSGPSAADISSIITASAAGAAALFDVILGRHPAPDATPAPVTTPAPDYPSQIETPSSSWVMPVAIVGGAVVLGGIVLLAFGGKKKSVAANRRRTRRNGRRRAVYAEARPKFSSAMPAYLKTPRMRKLLREAKARARQ